MQLPPPRGPLSAWLDHRLTGGDDGARTPEAGPSDRPYADEDLQLALWVAYELQYRGFDEVDPDRQWDPEVIAFRTRLERPWVDWLEANCRIRPTDEPVATQLRALIDADDGPRLAPYLRRHATKERFRQFVLHRSVYQLKEADPHSFGIPRLDGAAKAALVEIEADEYGGGRRDRMHSELFRTTMRWLALDDSYGYYVPEVPAVTLAVSNVMSLFAVHRRWTGALLGHLAALEMTSTLPNRQYAAGAIRLGASDEEARYFTEHVEADAVHEQIAAHDLCGSYVEEHPGAIGDVLFGAACSLAVDNLFAEHLLAGWRVSGRQLRRPAAAAS
ncbi:iron-containing redox enzyme family protein [Kribbella turkmenica]|uniref:Iron-containing redox enzyme family protein n=1 Tax=Kribbella turkmenica TaxID=2530375 RepID=A0A4R4WP61_9ACTN|nr:iron-containing redox enzyme family protein [Kribbella turkmenica]TDD17995.1 iron-containing redox enzyme family protein [Kribbella turkmenica]